MSTKAIPIDERLFLRSEAKAKQQGKAIQAVVEAYLRSWVGSEPQQPARKTRTREKLYIVRPGDTLRTEAEVVEAHPSSSQLECGVLRMKYSTLNQHGETVMTMTVIHLLKRRGVED